MSPEPLELARCIDRVRRTWASWRDELTVREVRGGWVVVERDAEPAEFPSQSRSRVNWLAPEAPVTASAVSEALEAVRSLGCAGLFLWLAPWACDAETEAALRGAGAAPQVDVEYLALGRAGQDAPPLTPGDGLVKARRLVGAQCTDVLDQVRPWYGDNGAAIAVRFAEPGRVELFAAFEGGAPIGVGLLMVDGDWAYLGAAGTEPEKRGRGAQTALIRARLARAAELGARWCGAETNTAVRTSLRNLERCGFRAWITWRVWKWDAGERLNR